MDKYLKEFDKIFGAKTKEHLKLNTPLLKKVFEYVSEDLYTTTDKYKKLRKNKLKIAKKLESTFNTDEQQALFEQYGYLNGQMESCILEQIFLYGYIFAKELDAETKIIE